jgi:DNA-binding LytR/AlgR family response regulator
MNCVIVDDELFAQKALEKCVERTDFLTLCGIYKNVSELTEGLKGKDIDLIFLDILLPGTTGIEFLRQIKNIPQVILVSSKKEFALEAFELDVTDYILKPIEYARFLKAGQKALNIHNTVVNNQQTNNEFFVKINQEMVKILLDEILFIEAYGDYVKMHSEAGKYVFLSTMKSLEAKLPENDFLRIHKSFIARVDKINKADNAHVFINDTKILVSRTYKDGLKERLNNLQF